MPKAPKPPPPPDPVPIPDIADPAVLAAGRSRKLQTLQAGSGRNTTQLADGGDAYSGDKLGLR
jgi:hypothetical protein